MGRLPDLLILTSSLPPLDFREAPRLALSALSVVTPDQVAAIMYTSGTTARPKGIMHTHISLIGATEMMCSWGIPEASAGREPIDAYRSTRMRIAARDFTRQHGHTSSHV
jgi:acyl-CoA synthetase (AMP-forming)/AMP-acid ligase II